METERRQCEKCRGTGRQGQPGDVHRRKCTSCHGFGYMIHPVVELPPAKPKHEMTARQRQGRARAESRRREQRKANGQCVDCGSPKLETSERCHDCAEYNRNSKRVEFLVSKVEDRRA